MNSYNQFAYVYDILTDDVNYAERAAYFNMLLEYHTKQKGILLDLACGTGSLTEELAKLGFDTIGVDGSSDMLNEAIRKRARSGLDIIYLNQDMRRLDMFGTVDVVVCALDSLNHLTKTEDLRQTMNKVSLFLHPDGYFLFDVNTVYKHQQVLGNNIFVYDYDEVYLVWRNALMKKNTIQINLDIFAREGNHYFRSTESFCERAYTQDELEKILIQAGLKIVSIYHEDSIEAPKPDSQRIVYVTKKG